MLVTVTGHGRLPYLGDLSVGSTATYCTLEDVTIGGDGLLTPDDEVELMIAVRNEGTSTAYGVTGSLGAGSPYGSVVSGALDFGDVAPGATAWATAPAIVGVPADAEHGAAVTWPLTVSAGGSDWESALVLDVTGTALSVDGASAPPAPGASGDLVVDLSNTGAFDATGLTGALTSDSPWIIVTDGDADFDDVNTGGSGDNAASPFALSVAADCYPGHLATLELTLTDAAGAVTVLPVPLQIGTASTDDPLGPDGYGYYAYDDTDVASGLAPTYDWIPIDPDSGGPGDDLGLSDFGWEEDDTKTVDLPFTFRYYGQDYDRVSICSNGWLAMGEMNLVHYRNFGIPSAGSPGAMIAPFWDNLYQTGTHRVYTWYDDVEHRFVVQWADMPNDYSNTTQNFEVVLYDPYWHQTSTGDGMILFQYETVGNTDSRDGYATVGIQNAERTDGLMYTFWNEYAGAAAPLASGRAILFMPLGEILQPAADVSPVDVAASAASGGQVLEYLHIGNTGEVGSKLNYSLEVVDPLTRSAAKSLAGSDVKLNATQYEPGTTVTLDVAATCISGDWEWLQEVILDLPAGVTVESATNMPTNHGTLNWDGTTGDGVTTSWGSGGYIDHEETAHADITLTFDAGLVGDVEIDWTVNGDNYGAPPHTVSGIIVLTPTDPAIYVTAPVDGVVATLGTSLDVEFLAVNGPATATVELQRESGGAWSTLATGVDLSLGSWSWTVAGDPGPYAVIRVTDELDPLVFGLSGVFAVGRDMGWLSLGSTEGQVDAGASHDITITLDATGLADGVYEADLDVIHNGGPAVTVPVTFTVGGLVAAELPTRVALLGAHPNPFNPQTTISFALPSDMPVTLNVYSAQGRLVRTLLAGSQPAGTHRVLWDGRDGSGREVASGVYLYRLTTPEGAQSGKAALLK